MSSTDLLVSRDSFEKPHPNMSTKLTDSAPANPSHSTPSERNTGTETIDELLSTPAPTPGQTLLATPYPHQVGGHGQLRMTLHGQLLKPLYEKEMRFYSYIHSDKLPSNLHWLRHTTPKFYGMSKTPPSTMPTSESAPALLGIKPKRPPIQWRVSSTLSITDISPWALTMGNRVRKKKSSHRPNCSIALEDLNHAFIFPSVLDCKIGTRHYDDDATPEKQRRHILKSEMTTSAKHGVRFTGMQSYKRVRCGTNGSGVGDAKGGGVSTGVLEFRDKYYGRKLKGEDLVPEASWFFHNGVSVRTDCIKIILEKLNYILQQVAHQTHFKFYSSSLLLVYEGASRELAPCNADVRMIDFAHTQWVEDGSEGRDEGYIFGIENLISILKQVIRDNEDPDTPPTSTHRPPAAPVPDQPVVPRATSPRATPPRPASRQTGASRARAKAASV